MAACTARTLLGLLAVLVAAVSAGHIEWSPPVMIGEVHWGVSSAVQPEPFGPFAVPTLTDMMLSTDSGKTYHSAYSLKKGPSVGADLARFLDDRVHDFGNVTAKPAHGTEWTQFESPTCQTWRLDATDALVYATNTSADIYYGVLPRPTGCSVFACPFRLAGCGSVAFDDGTLLQTAIVWWQDSEKHPKATTLVTFTSTDAGFTWNYTGVVADAKDFPSSEEGPNENDVALLPSGRVLVVVRLDGGDGPETHPFVNYRLTHSDDRGKTWSPLVEIPNAGCARPRLLVTDVSGDAEACAIVLSGGRHRNNGTDDNQVWVDWSCTGEGPWEMHAVSYQHNRLAGSGIPHYTSRVNTTENPRRVSPRHSRHRLALSMQQQGDDGVHGAVLRLADGSRVGVRPVGEDTLQGQEAGHVHADGVCCGLSCSAAADQVEHSPVVRGGSTPVFIDSIDSVTFLSVGLSSIFRFVVVRSDESRLSSRSRPTRLLSPPSFGRQVLSGGESRAEAGHRLVPHFFLSGVDDNRNMDSPAATATTATGAATPTRAAAWPGDARGRRHRRGGRIATGPAHAVPTATVGAARPQTVVHAPWDRDAAVAAAGQAVRTVQDGAPPRVGVLLAGAPTPVPTIAAAPAAAAAGGGAAAAAAAATAVNDENGGENDTGDGQSGEELARLCV